MSVCRRLYAPSLLGVDDNAHAVPLALCHDSLQVVVELVERCEVVLAELGRVQRLGIPVLRYTGKVGLWARPRVKNLRACPLDHFWITRKACELDTDPAPSVSGGYVARCSVLDTKGTNSLDGMQSLVNLCFEHRSGHSRAIMPGLEVVATESTDSITPERGPGHLLGLCCRLPGKEVAEECVAHNAIGDQGDEGE